MRRQPANGGAARRQQSAAAVATRALWLGPTVAAVLCRLRGLARHAALPRRSVRLRLTALYGVLFLVSGAGLLAITNTVARGWPRFRAGRAPIPSGRGLGQNIQHAARSGIHQSQTVAIQVASQHWADVNRLLAGSAIALGVMAVVSVALGWIVAGRVLRPLREMAATTRRISAENLGERLAVAGPGDELKDLGDTIDALLVRLESAFTAQRLFVANASHELRTPLAMMRTSVDVAVAKPAPVPAEVTVLAGKLREGLDQADRLLESLLLLARAQHSAPGDQETVPLGGVLASAIEARAEAIAGLGLRVQLATAEACVAGNAILLSRMTGNLIDNAIRHNKPGGWICAETATTGNTAHLAVENAGPVLDPGSVAELAQPFRRLGAERTGSTGGTGLGLSIVAAITEAHGGTLRLHARPQGGLRALIELPAATGTGLATAAAGAGALQ